MTDTPTCEGTDQFLASTGQTVRHMCTLPAGHAGNHTCACTAGWPRRNLAFETWHAAHPSS